jgi:hypothetical protein
MHAHRPRSAADDIDWAQVLLERLDEQLRDAHLRVAQSRALVTESNQLLQRHRQRRDAATGGSDDD